MLDPRNRTCEGTLNTCLVIWSYLQAITVDHNWKTGFKQPKADGHTFYSQVYSRPESDTFAFLTCRTGVIFQVKNYGPVYRHCCLCLGKSFYKLIHIYTYTSSTCTSTSTAVIVKHNKEQVEQWRYFKSTDQCSNLIKRIQFSYEK